MEMAPEIMVFLGVGMVLLGLLTYFVYNMDFADNADTLSRLYEGDVEESMRLDMVQFTNSVRDFWDWCNHSSAPEPKIYYVYNSTLDKDGILTREGMYNQYKSLGHCKSIQSRNLSCGTREDINMSDIQLPSVIHVSCQNSTLYIG